MKKTIESNFRVVVYPKGNSYLPNTDEYLESVCKEIKDQIKRHVDDVSFVEIHRDIEEVCSFCEFAWDEDEDGVPCCCTKAQDEWAKNNPEKAYLLEQ